MNLGPCIGGGPKVCTGVNQQAEVGLDSITGIDQEALVGLGSIFLPWVVLVIVVDPFSFDFGFVLASALHRGCASG